MECSADVVECLWIGVLMHARRGSAGLVARQAGVCMHGQYRCQYQASSRLLHNLQCSVMHEHHALRVRAGCTKRWRIFLPFGADLGPVLVHALCDACVSVQSVIFQWGHAT
jgi:hypothetical protein